MNSKEFIQFLINAKKNTYANGDVAKDKSSRLGSKDYHYENDDYIYHDTYFGGVKFIGEEVVYDKNKIPFWAMNYYGVTIDEDLSEEVMDKVLRVALMKVGEDNNIIPVRGPSEFSSESYQYTFKVDGDIENFTGVEEIYRNKYRTFEEANIAIFKYIESWYNRKRLHSSINYMTPDQCELMARSAA